MARVPRRRRAGPVRPVAVVSFAQSPSVRREETRNDVEMLMPVIVDVFDKVGLTKDDMGFVCSGSLRLPGGGAVQLRRWPSTPWGRGRR